MKKSNKWLRSPIVTVVAFVVAAVLLLGAGIGTTRAALDYRSQVYSTQIGLDDIDVELLEDGTSTSTLLTSLKEYESGESVDKVTLGTAYEEKLSVRNPKASDNSINEYVRVTIHKYWTDNSNKDRKLSPKLIELKLGEADLFDDTILNYGNWIKDKSSTTDERVVLYYNKLLNAGDPTDLFADNITINKAVMKGAKQTTTGNKIVTEYAYDGMRFNLEVEVDGVQEHNASDAVISAWGNERVSISGTSLSVDNS